MIEWSKDGIVLEKSRILCDEWHCRLTEDLLAHISHADLKRSFDALSPHFYGPYIDADVQKLRYEEFFNEDVEWEPGRECDWQAMSMAAIMPILRY
jgi:hypothetical protein